MEGSVDSSQALTNQILSDVRSCTCVLHYLFVNVLQAWRGIASNRRHASAHAYNYFRVAAIAHLGHKNSSPCSHL